MPTGGPEGTSYATLLGAPLGVEPHRAHHGQHQVDEEEQRQGQAAVHLLCASFVELHFLQPFAVGHQTADAVVVRVSLSHHLVAMLPYETAGVDAGLQTDDVLAKRIVQRLRTDGVGANGAGHHLAKVFHHCGNRQLLDIGSTDTEASAHHVGRSKQCHGPRAGQHYPLLLLGDA